MTRAFLALWAVLVLFQFTQPAAAQQRAPYIPVQTSIADLAEFERATVTEVIRPDMLRTASGKIYILDNIRVPRMYDERAVAYLTQHVLNKEISFYANTSIGPGALDRFGNRIAHAATAEGGIWIQGELVGQGLAWADSTAENRDLIIPLLALEAKARNNGKGFWGAPGLRVRTGNQLEKDINSFQVFEGTVFEVTDKRTVVFLNFSPDWKTDTTLRLGKVAVELFRQKRFFLHDYKNVKIRTRGWVRMENGPMIDVTHPEQIEIISPLPEKTDLNKNPPAQSEPPAP